MSIDLPSDSELHARALTYRVNRPDVTYAQALAAAVAGFEPAAPGTGADAFALPGARAADAAGGRLSDTQLHAAATAYAQRNAVSYWQALQTVRGRGASFSEAGGTPASALQAQPIEIFRAGEHVDSEGTTRTFTPADLYSIAVAYDPARHEAPLTVGHSQNNRPAFGWVKALEATPDGRLLMRAGQVDPEFARMVEAGRYKKRSASFYQPSDPSNPTPGRWYLQHVAWLGAQPPSVKGLADLVFAAAARA